MKEAGLVLYRERDSNPHGALAPTDFKSVASTVPPSRPKAASSILCDTGSCRAQPAKIKEKSGIAFP